MSRLKGYKKELLVVGGIVLFLGSFLIFTLLQPRLQPQPVAIFEGTPTITYAVTGSPASIKECTLDEVKKEIDADVSKVKTSFKSVGATYMFENLAKDCRFDIKKRLAEILSKVNADYTNVGGITYVSEGSFAVSFYKKLFLVDMFSGQVTTLYSTTAETEVAEVVNTHVFYENNRALLVYQVMPTGLGCGGPDLDNCVIGLKTMLTALCKKNIAGIWMYDSLSKKSTRMIPGKFPQCGE